MSAGPLTTALRAAPELAGTPVLTPAQALDRTGEGWAVVVLEEWTPGLADAIGAHAFDGGPTLVPVALDGATALVGPVQAPGAPVCLGCAEAGRLATLGGRTPRSEPQLALGGLVPPALVPLVAALAARLAADLAPQGGGGRVLAVRAVDCSTSEHRARTRGEGCARCGPLPVDTPAAVRLSPGRVPVAEPGSLRGANPHGTAARLREVLHDWRYGPVAHVSRGERVVAAIAAAEVVADWVDRDGGYGRATTYGEAERVALFEAVERVAGMNPRGRRTAVRASFAELGPDRALDVETLGRHEPHHVVHPLFDLTPYAPDVPTTWVHGWSAARRAPLLVPEHVAYWGGSATRSAERGAGGVRFVAESSNGCGLGASLEEALLYALFEVAERDAFLMAWYTRSRLQAVAVPDEDPLVAHLHDRLDALGYDLLLFDATNDLGVPAVLSLAACRDAGSPAPQAFFAGGAHHDPRRAIASAVAETAVNVVQSTGIGASRPAYFDRDRLAPLLTSPQLVTGIDEHVGLMTLPQARPRYQHLLDAAATPRPWREVWGGPAPVSDLGALLTATTGRFVAAGCDVVVVDQTDPRLAAELGLHAAKAVVPGAIPMTFGEVRRRTRGLPRLLEVPPGLGRVDGPPRYVDLPLDPHPFP